MLPFRRELERWLSLSNRTNIDPFEVRSSYAGAVGLGQFMPSSWSRFAVDFDGDSRIICSGAPTDAGNRLPVANFTQGPWLDHRHAHALQRAIRPPPR